MIELPKWLKPKQALALFLAVFFLLMLAKLFSAMLIGGLSNDPTR